MITQAAVKDTNGKIWALPKPNRHGNIINLLLAKDLSLEGTIMGFTDETGKFYNREEAWVHVIESKQPIYIYNPINPKDRWIDPNPDKTGSLFSEDLW